MKSSDFNKNEEVIKRLQLILDAENPCNIITDSDGTVHCREDQPCCNHCSKITKHGCINIPSACKFYFCPTAWAFLSENARVEIQSLGQEFVGDLRLRGDRQKLNEKPPFIW